LSRVAALAPDLFFASKIEATLTAAGHEVVVRSAPPLPDDAEVVIVDLDQVAASVELPPGAPVLAFYSHVDVETKKGGEEAGFELVVPRSRMAREMPELVARLVASRA
jgi:acetylornithine deacetylase/succinyl-diaminopimelate desuccinylase-like protein